jgi:hypothetical protein
MSDQPTDQVPVIESSGEATRGIVGLTPLAQQYLDQTRPWVRFISIMSFVSVGFMLLVGAGMMVFSVLGGLVARNEGGAGRLASAIGGGALSLVYVILALVYVFPGVYLFRYAGAIKQLKVNANAAALEDALKHQKSFWRYVGILMAVACVLAVVGVILGVVVGALAAMMATRS